ncbi:hypothetical protein SRRS_54460 [Sporomusa rhizae]
MKKSLLLICIMVVSIMCLLPTGVYSAEPSYNLEVKTIQNRDDFINYYILKKENQEVGNKNLIIYLNGSELTPVIGTNQKNKPYFTSMLNTLNQYCSANFDMLIPEKINIGQAKDYSNDLKVISHYTVEERALSAVTVVDDFLSENNYKRVILVGASDGGAILPKVYNGLKNKGKVSNLIIMAGGGLSQYDDFKLLQQSKLPNMGVYRKELLKLDMTMEEIKKDPNSLTKQYLGWPFKRWSSFMDYRPLDELLKIDTPILVLHGDLDISTPVESSRAVEEEFTKKGKKNLSYIEYKGWDHQLSKHMNIILKDISDWLRKMNR